MAAADETRHSSVGEPQPVAVPQAAERRRRRRDATPVQIAARGALLDQRVVEAGPAVEAAPSGDPLLAGVLREQARGQPLGPAGPELRPGLGAQPAGEAHVIGMVVRGDDAGDRPAGQQAARAAPPARPRRVISQPGVDHGPPPSPATSQTLTWSRANGSAKRTP